MPEEGQKKQVNLTQEDINSLLLSSASHQVEVTKKIAQFYNLGRFSDEQKHMAEDMFRALVENTQDKVKQTLAELINKNNNVPKDVILSLAYDINAVSLPILEFSEVISESELINIVKTSEDTQKQLAISHRKDVSEDLSDALVETHNFEVVDSLLHNEGAKIGESSFAQITQEYKDNEQVLTSLVQRGEVPVAIIENLANSISSTLYEKLKDKNKDFKKYVEDHNLIDESSKMATMKMMGFKSSKQELKEFEDLVHKLNITDNLTPISALCMGNIHIFEISISRITHIPIVNVKTLFDDATNKGFKALYEKAKLPEDLYIGAEILVETLREMSDKIEFRGLVATKESAKQIYANFLEKTLDKEGLGNIEYIKSLICHNINDSRDF